MGKVSVAGGSRAANSKAAAVAGAAVTREATVVVRYCISLANGI
jgi:hypothetical protein